MRWNDFGRSAAFAALSALAMGAWVTAAGPVVGIRRSIVLYLVGLVATYVAGIGPSPRYGLRAGVAAAAFGSLLACATRSLGELALGLGIVLAVARSGVLHRMSGARAVVIEAALVAGGLVFARWLAGPSLLSLMLALWGFLLVQSLYFLVGGRRARRSESGWRDPFEAAHDRALALLDGGGV